MADQLYHGTRAGFSGQGGLLLPPTAHHGPTNHAASDVSGREHWVYLTPDLDLAWSYAYAAKGDGRPRVLVCRAVGVEVDDSTVNGREVESFMAEYAYVDSVIFATMAEDSA